MESSQLSQSLLNTMTIKSPTGYAGVPTSGRNPNVAALPVATAIVSAGEEPSSFGSIPTATKHDTASGREKNGLSSPDGYDNEDIHIEWEKGEAQPPEYRDKWFAAVFLVHLLTVFGTAITLGGSASAETSEEQEDSNANYDYGNNGEENDDVDSNFNSQQFNTDQDGSGSSGVGGALAIAFVALLLAPTLAFAAVGLMSKNAELLIRISLWFSVGLCGLTAVVCTFFGAWPVGIFYGILTVCLVKYAQAVQNKIPYAASNLRCGIQAIRTNMGIGFASLGAIVFLTIFTATWCLGFAGVMELDSMKVAAAPATSTTNGNYQDISDNSSDLSGLGATVGTFFLLSYFWTHQVATNVVRTSVSGVVGTWWFSPREASACCSMAVRDSFSRSTTYSLGSICFGSLIVAIIQVIRSILRSSANNNRGGGIVRCIAICILFYVERIVEYFNKWAFIYVGLYGYDYLNAGKRVMSLFKTRGWSTVISDNLVNRLLVLVSLIVSLLVGFCTMLVAFFIEEFEPQNTWLRLYGFIIGFVIGLIVSNIVMSLLSSSVDAIIVCYAEAPQEFSDSHPALAQEMHASWSSAWPDLISTGTAAMSIADSGGII